MQSNRTLHSPPAADDEGLHGWGSTILGREGPFGDPQADSLEAVPSCLRPGNAKLLIVDDEQINVDILEAYLQEAGHSRITSFTDPVDALLGLSGEEFDVVFLDIMMPRLSGLDILGQIRESERARHMPVIVLTASIDRDLRRQALSLGATDFLTKPFDPEELLARTGNALIRKAHYDSIRDRAAELARQVERRTAELVSSQMQLVQCLARAAEYRDNDTGLHVVRVARYAGLIARELRLAPAIVRQIQLAATLHDVGKIATPDSILLKPGPLTHPEIEIMRKHARLGEEILAGRTGGSTSHELFPEVGSEVLLGSFESPLLKMAATIAATHHEHWNGLGYPAGLVGEEIPLEGRIVAVADVYDALASARPYKAPFTHERCLTILEEGRGRQFDPAIVDAFLAVAEEVEQVRRDYRDPETPA